MKENLKKYYEDKKEFIAHPFVKGLPMHEFEGKKFCTPTLDDYWNGPWFTRTLTIVRRRKVYVEQKTIKRYKIAYDYITCYYMMKAGKCALFEEVMGVYSKEASVRYDIESLRELEDMEDRDTSEKKKKK